MQTHGEPISLPVVVPISWFEGNNSTPKLGIPDLPNRGLFLGLRASGRGQTKLRELIVHTMHYKSGCHSTYFFCVYSFSQCVGPSSNL